MKIIVGILLTALFLTGCKQDNSKEKVTPANYPTAIIGTWQLLSGKLIEKGDTVVTDYTKNTSFIKIINSTHFAFLQHDLQNGKDSTKTFEAGGGTYSIKDSLYTEHLEYCSARNWEGNSFPFIISIKNDTLIQRGIEEVKSEGIHRINIETYVRLK